jgi:tRNA (guanine37-N1)-methyltransferase
MKFDVLTLFPEMFEPMKQSIIGRALKNEIFEINFTNIRDFSKDKHKKVDDTPYGGGAGMLMKPDVVWDAYNSVKSENSKTIYMSPQGKTLTQAKVEELAKEEHIIIICGHYEGIDQRVIDKVNAEEISIGDYVLTGGELPAMVLIDSVSRYIDGVLKQGSKAEESFSNDLLEYPQYTRPEEFLGERVPEVLISGNHQKIDKWRREKSLEVTLKKRPELLEKANLTEEDKKFLRDL